MIVPETLKPMPTVKESLKILETIRKQKNAFIGALVLSATAPNKKKSDDCISLIQSFGSGLTEFEIEECMQMVEKILGNDSLLNKFFNSSVAMQDMEWVV